MREEIHLSSLFSHPNLLPLLGHAIISVKVISQSGYFYLIYNCYSYIFLNINLTLTELLHDCCFGWTTLV